jgi:prepilin-type N-terminal cleavage/methylation domain-containing protein
MNRQAIQIQGARRSNAGFSVIELVIVLLLVAIILVFAIPQVISSRRQFSFASIQRQSVSSLRDARQTAINQRQPITFRYEDTSKQMIIYGAGLGALGDAKNLVVRMSGNGLRAGNIKYGIPTGVTPGALGDGTSMTALTVGVVEITFQGDGSVLDGSENPIDGALFFYHELYGKDAAFAVSVLGATGRVKLWRYSNASSAYVE